MYDILIIGSGPAGYVAAIRAAQLGMTVACVEKGFVGGTCLNIGCIPSKTLLDTSLKHYKLVNEYSEHGIEAKDVRIDLHKMMFRKEEVIKQLTTGVEALFKSNKVNLINGSARIIGNSYVEVQSDDGNTKLEAKNIIIATGSSPSELEEIKIGNHVVDNEGALKFQTIPKSIAVIGAGVIGLELGSLWSRLGSHVTVIEAQKEFLPMLDQRISRQASREFINQGLDIKLGCETLKVKENSNGLDISFNYKNEEIALEVEKIILAVGRKPNTKDLFSGDLLTIDEKGFIEVDEYCQTSVKNIWAIGDVVRGPMLAHKASEEGVMVVERIAKKEAVLNYKHIPNVIYTWPEVSSVGKTENQLKDEKVDYKIGKFPMRALGRARASSDLDGFVKIIADKKSDEILGVHIIGARAADLIVEGVTAMEFRASCEDISIMSHPHPTYSEAMKEAALSALDNRPIHI